jgi:geranylgeranyl pyrophosphate synthase
MAQPEEEQHLLHCLGNIDMTNDELQRAREIIKDCGALTAIEEMAKDCIKKAKESLQLLPDNKYRQLLNELADFLIQRKF